ncbi:hypothetical protein [Rufibacter roseus]|uniref:Uncharacterized protein n=1 Tax=Rufibacter roseus TaxID=1567108 RepID=A0ABW2DRB1_9BACT|nr:hypothetical protein [Rufibacter roseus]
MKSVQDAGYRSLNRRFWPILGKTALKDEGLWGGNDGAGIF